MASKKTPEINGGSMADIAFLMLIFFLMVTTMDSEEGLARRLPPMPEKGQDVVDSEVNRRNILTVRINQRNNLYAGGKYLSDASELEEIVVEFLTNPTNDSKLPTRTLKTIEGFGDYLVSDGVISLQNDRGTSYDMYMETQNVLVKAINGLRDRFAMQNWGKPYAGLDEEKQEIVRKAIPQKISEQEPKEVGRKN